MWNIKQCFTSRFPGGKIVEVDWAQLEVVMLQVESQDEVLRQELNEGIDLHCSMTAEVFHVPYAIVHKACTDSDIQWLARRKKMKSARFALQYGAGVKRIAEQAGWSEAEAKVFVDAYYSRYKGIKVWNQHVKNTVLSTAKLTGDIDIAGEPVYKGQYTSPNGRRYVFSGTKNKYGKLSFPPTKLQNYPIQGLASDFVKMMRSKVIQKVYDYTCANCAIPINTIHDSVMFDCNNEEAVGFIKQVIDDQYGRATRYLSEMLFAKRKIDVPFNYTLKVGDNWS